MQKICHFNARGRKKAVSLCDWRPASLSAHLWQKQQSPHLSWSQGDISEPFYSCGRCASNVVNPRLHIPQTTCIFKQPTFHWGYWKPWRKQMLLINPTPVTLNIPIQHCKIYIYIYMYIYIYIYIHIYIHIYVWFHVSSLLWREVFDICGTDMYIYIYIYT